MRTVGIITLIIWILSSGITQQFWKFPELIQHFEEHRATQTDLQFGEFLYMHYVGSDNNMNDDNKDANLPFKSSEETDSLAMVIRFKIEPTFLELNTCQDRKSLQSQDDQLTTRPSSEVFRPPLT